MLQNQFPITRKLALGAIRNASYYLKRHLPAERGELAEHLDIIDEEVTTADGIITNLLRIARSRRPATQDVDLARLLDGVLARAAQRRQFAWHTSVEPDPFVIRADAGQMQQVLANLADNAAEAVADCGGEVRVEASRGGGQDTIIFRDTGSGVPHVVRGTLFEPLVTTKARGTGLGLTVCRQIIEAHGGQIELLESPSPGTAFRIQLPHPPLIAAAHVGQEPSR